MKDKFVNEIRKKIRERQFLYNIGHPPFSESIEDRNEKERCS